MIDTAMQPLRVAWLVVAKVGDRAVVKAIFQVHFLMCSMIFLGTPRADVEAVGNAQAVVLTCDIICVLT